MKEIADHTRIVSVDEMQRLEKEADAGGQSYAAMMEQAGTALAEAIQESYPGGADRSVLVLVGPGNNGGDGFVIARLLAGRGWPVRVALLGGRERLKGDARINADRWTGPVEAMSAGAVADAELVVDAVFGAGLVRDVDGEARAAIEAMFTTRPHPRAAMPGAQA